MTVWNTVNGMRDREASVTITLGQALDTLQNEKVEAVAELRQANVGEYIDADLLLEQTGAAELIESLGVELPEINMTVGEMIDEISRKPDVQAHLADSHTFLFTIGEVIDLVGEDKVADALQNKVAEASHVADYDNTRENILKYWFRLLVFVLAFAALSTITLEFIDKDKR